MEIEPTPQGLLLIVSGPAGTGKTTLCDRMLAEVPNVERVVTATTRPPRDGEVNTVDYHFFDHPTFEAKVAAGDFYEHARVHTNIYGVLKSEVQTKLKAGIDLLLNIDVQGAETFRQAGQTDPLLRGRVVSVFIMPPSLDELERRLKGRGTDDAAEIERRLQVAREEVKHCPRYDYCLHTTSKDADFQNLLAIYRAEKMRNR